MKKSLFLIALASMAVVGCSKDEITEINPDNAIKFTATAAKATRSSITTTSNLSDFYMYAYASNDTSSRFMDGVVGKENNATTWAYKSATKFWPNTGTVNFYAVHPESVVKEFGMTNTVSATSQTIKDFIVEDDVEDQIDLIYATALEESKPATTNSPVMINFRHALSQIVFQAQVTNSALSVVIDGVKVGKLANKSTLTFPSKDTTPHRDEDPGNLNTEDDTTEGDTWGDWSERKTGSVVYAAGITKGTNINSEIVDLTTADSGALLLLPQNTTAWTATGGITDNTTGSYFLVSCKIKDASSGVYLWGSANEYKEVAVPFSADWKQGKKYIYKFIFNDGGGYDPDNGDPVLVPIKFTVTVDEFQSANEIPFTM